METRQLDHRQKILSQVSRREFLAIAGMGVAGVVMWPLLTEGDKVVTYSGLEIMKRPELLNSLFDKGADSIDASVLSAPRAASAPKIEINHNYRAVFEQLQEGIESFRHQGGLVKYSRMIGWEGMDYYDGAIRGLAGNKFKELRAEGRSVNIFDGLRVLHSTALRFYDVIPDSLKDIMFYQDSPYLCFLNASGVGKKVCAVVGGCLPRLADYPENAWVWDKHFSFVDDYFGAVRQYVEAEVEKNGGRPVSASKILGYSLLRNGGLLAESIFDTALFLQRSARTVVPSGGDIKEDNKDEKWMADNILDEYGKVDDYALLPPGMKYPYLGRDYIVPSPYDEDLSRLNQIGKPYHAWSMVSKLVAFPPQIIEVASAIRLYELFNQGKAKLASVMHVGVELGKIDQYLMSFS